MNDGKIPSLWSQAGWEGVITMYLGGWKYQSANAGASTNPEANSVLASLYPNKVSDSFINNGGNSRVDRWQKATKDSPYVDPYPEPSYDGFSINSFGNTENARSEFVEKGVPGKYDHDFKGFPNGNPFTVPCIGTFVKFEPEKNGKVVLYVIQNGIVDLTANGEKGTGHLQTTARWRPTYIVDELGKMLTDNVTAETQQTIYIGMDEERHANATNSSANYTYEITDTDGSTKKTITVNGETKTFHETDKDSISDFWRAVKALYDGCTSKQQTALNKYWGTNAGEFDDSRNPKYDDKGKLIQRKMEMIPPSETDDGWIAINKAYVKYTFPVKAGKSYYVLNNDSKLGFCGYEFTPDGTTTTSELTLNEDGTYQKGNDKGSIGKTLNGIYDKVILNRKFHAGWNVICLPFSVTESKMREWFGSEGKVEDYELVTYNGVGIHNDRVKAFFFHHVYQDILAGYPYMLWIPENAPVLTKNQNPEFKNITIEDECFDMKVFTVSTDYTTEASADLMNVATKDYYSFQGFYEPTQLVKDSYVVTANGLQFYGDETYGSGDLTLDGLRAYLKGNDTSEAKERVRISGTNFTNILERMDDWNASVIDDIAEEMGFFSRPSNVYSISGQIVRPNSTSLVGLPKGIYIVNGKKYIVNK